jgi:hypothetical protein
MANDFALNSLLSTFLDDPHEIPSELDVSALSQKEVETQINRTLSHPSFLTAMQMSSTQ